MLLDYNEAKGARWYSHSFLRFTNGNATDTHSLPCFFSSSALEDGLDMVVFMVCILVCMLCLQMFGTSVVVRSLWTILLADGRCSC